MVRWIVALAFALQASTAFAQDKCGSSSITRGNVHLSVAAQQRGIQRFPTTNTSVIVLSADKQMRFLVNYELGPEGLITPSILHINTAPTEDVRPEIIRWRRNGGESKRFPRPAYPRTIGDFSFMVAQRVSGFESFDQRTEELDELRQGGRYTVERVSESGEVLATGLIEYPDETTINALYAEAFAQAVARFSVCEPPAIMRAPARS